MHASRVSRLIAAACAAVGFLGLAGSGRAEEPLVDKSGRPATPDQLQRIETWRKQFPYESLVERLAYEKPFRDGPTPQFTEENEERLGRFESSLDPLSQSRSQALHLLHSDQVVNFVSRDGLGLSRMPISVSPYYLNPPPPVRTEFVQLPPASSGEVSTAPTLQLRGDRGVPAKGDRTYELLPTRYAMYDLNFSSNRTFGSRVAYGDVQSRDRVAGFAGHAFLKVPELPFDAAVHPSVPHELKQSQRNKLARWKLTRLELVSLLKHPTPVVYQSDHLPEMNKLKTAPTRPLNPFESASLAKLREGEEVQTSSTINRIEMLGAVRAAKQCLQCHEVPRGTLLGAFSYQLHRDPPVQLPRPVEAVQ